jgi:hypothetical protein
VLDRVHYYDARVAHGCASAQVYDDVGDTVSRVTRFNMPPIPDAVQPEHPLARSAADVAAAPPQQPSPPARAAAAPTRAVPHAGSAATTVLRVDLRAPAQGEPRLRLAERQPTGSGAPHGELTAGE